MLSYKLQAFQTAAKYFPLVCQMKTYITQRAGYILMSFHAGFLLTHTVILKCVT